MKSSGEGKAEQLGWRQDDKGKFNVNFKASAKETPAILSAL
jgi:hypothetical protein